jgi:5-hydroxyisourate hydrolase
MGLSTHVLDTMHGTPAGGMAVTLLRVKPDADGGGTELVKRFTLDANGRNPDGLLYGHDELRAGRYRLSFEVQAYFAARGVALPEPAFLDVVHIDFGVAEPSQHYHVPLLVSPWSYSTYRGS